MIEETDPRRQLQAYAATQPGVWGRVGPLLRVLDAAATTDDSLVELRDRHAAVWTVCAQANYDSLVTARGWTPAEYRDWLAETLAGSLLSDS